MFEVKETHKPSLESHLSISGEFLLTHPIEGGGVISTFDLSNNFR
jgi:hypothetical protein